MWIIQAYDEDMQQFFKRVLPAATEQQGNTTAHQQGYGYEDPNEVITTKQPFMDRRKKRFIDWQQLLRESDLSKTLPSKLLIKDSAAATSAANTNSLSNSNSNNSASKAAQG